MNVLITGASGFLGGHTAELLVASGHKVRGLVRHTSRTELLEALGVEVVRGDLKDHLSLRRAVDGMDAVVHAASTKSGVPEEYTEATVNGARALLEAARDGGVRRFVHISSISVYKFQRLRPWQEIDEHWPREDDPALLTNYSRSKIGAERVALGAAAAGSPEVVVLRPGLLYGPRGEWNLPRMGYPLGASRYVVIGRGHNVLPVCYVRNCAGAILLAVEQELASGLVLNVLDDELFTQNEYLARLKAEVRPGMRVLHLPYGVARAMGAAGALASRLLARPNPIQRGHLLTCHTLLRYSNVAAKKMLGWRPETGKDEALSETMRHLAGRERVSRRADLKALSARAARGTPLRACLVGCGAIAREHLKILDGMRNADVLALCDENLEAARRLAAEFGVPRTYDDASEMLKAEAPNVLHVLTPPQSHARYVELAAASGCHVLVEKPMAVNAAEAERMKKLTDKAGVRLCVDHNHLYDPVMVRARRLIESGAVGDIFWVESYYGFNLGGNPRSRYMMPGGEKHWTFDLPGGMYQNLAAHPLCLALELLGPPTGIRAQARYGRVLPHAPTDELRVMLETDEAGGLVTISLAASPRMQYLEVFGTRMVLRVDFLNKWLLARRTVRGVPKALSRALTNFGEGVVVSGGTLSGMLRLITGRWTPYDGMGLLIREFYGSLQQDREPPVTAQEGVAVMSVMDRVWKLVGPDALRRKGEDDA